MVGLSIRSLKGDLATRQPRAVIIRRGCGNLSSLINFTLFPCTLRLLNTAKIAAWRFPREPAKASFPQLSSAAKLFAQPCKKREEASLPVSGNSAQTEQCCRICFLPLALHPLPSIVLASPFYR